VRAGQLLARIDERETAAGLARSEAAVLQASAEERNARLNAERSRELRARGFISQAALDTAETQLKAAQAGVQQVQAGRNQAALARGFTAVTAPFDGLVLATHFEVGDLAAPGRPIVTLYAPKPLRAVVQVPASRAAIARSARTIEVQMPSGAWVKPEGSLDLPGADPVSQTVEWRLDLPTAATDDVLPGQSVRVRFGGADAPAGTGALVVPTAAVLRRGELTAVYVAQGERFVLRAVRLGAERVGGLVEVLAGLRGGERIALDAVRAGLADATPSPAK
jgi:RND family efflux transporter MFP subunit